MLTTTVCAALSAAGLAVAFLTAYRRRFVAALRIAAVALLPIGLALAGLVKLGGDLAAAIGDWAAGLVLRPTVWTGFGVLAAAVLLYVIARFAERRSGGRAGRREQRDAGQRGRAGTGGDRGGGPPAVRSGGAGGGGADDDDFSEIEEILRKHGI